MVKVLMMLLPWMLMRLDELIEYVKARQRWKDSRGQGCKDEEV